MEAGHMQLAKRGSRASNAPLSKGYELQFRNVVYKVDKKDILKGVSGSALPGEMLAIMGPSGAGKTTLLNVLAGRKPLDGGLVKLNGRPLTKQMRRKISYVLQHDTFLSELTFWDTLWFTAQLRLPGSMPEKEKRNRVDEIIDALDMKKCLKTIMGDEMKRGLSGGEKKRANIACELLTNPALMLLDEPTSGLDSSTAYSLMHTLKGYAQLSGKTVIATIHQPSSQIFKLFDKLLLLADGEVAYFGELEKTTEYFSDLGLPCPNSYNMADHILDLAKHPSPEVRSQLIGGVKDNSKLSSIAESNEEAGVWDGYVDAPNQQLAIKGSMDYTNPAYVDDLNGSYRKFSTISGGQQDDQITDLEMAKYQKEYNAKWPTNFWTQFVVLCQRCFKQSLPKILNKWNVLQCLITGVFAGLCWFQTKPEEGYLTDRFGAIYMLMLFYAFSSVMGGVEAFPMERPVVNKERLAGYYRLSAYYVAKGVSELPLVMLLPVTFFTILYWMAGFNYSFLVYLQMLAVVSLGILCAHGIGLLYGALIADAMLAFIMSITTMVFCMLAGGFYIQNFPFWLEWLKYLSFMRYSYMAALDIDLRNKPISCAPMASRYCNDSTNGQVQLIPTETLLLEFTLYGDGWQLWHNVVVLIGIITVLRISTYLVLRFIRKPKAV